MLFSYSFIVYSIISVLDNPGYNIEIKKLNKEKLLELYKKNGANKVLTFGRDTFAVFDK